MYVRDIIEEKHLSSIIIQRIFRFIKDKDYASIKR